MWKGFSVQLWKPCKKRRKRKIAATPKDGAKNQLLWPEGVHQENTDEHRNRAGEGDGVVGTNADETSNFELTQHEADQCESTVQGDESPKAAELTPADKIALGFWTPEQ